MATPVKRARLIVVSDKNLCLLCNLDKKQPNQTRNLILDSNGMRGAGYELAVFNYCLDFALVDENFGSYVCDMCARIVWRIKKN